MKGERGGGVVRTIRDCDPVVDFERIIHQLSRRLHFLQPLVLRTLHHSFDVFIGIVVRRRTAEEALTFLLLGFRLLILITAHLLLLLGRLI